MGPNRKFPADLVTFTEEILNGKLHFFVQCSLLVQGPNFIEYSFSLHVVKLKLAVFNDGTEKFKCCAKHGAHLIPSAGPDNQNQLFKGKCCGNKPI